MSRVELPLGVLERSPASSRFWGCGHSLAEATRLWSWLHLHGGSLCQGSQEGPRLGLGSAMLKKAFPA